ncbi:IclR family transcriptional regulator [Arthrobacter pigmenti]
MQDKEALAPPSNGSTSSPAPAVSRAAALLDILASSETGTLTLSDIARGLSIPKSSASNLLLALESSNLVERRTTGFALGRKLVELGGAYLSRLDEVQEFYRFCERAPTLSMETVRIALLDKTDVIYLARYEGHPAVRLTANIGDRMPASLCAVGKVLLARLRPHDIDELYPDGALPSMTSKSLTTVAALKDEIPLIRKRGYAVEDEESTTGVMSLAVGVPTHGVHGPNLGVSVTALKATFTQEQEAAMVSELQELAYTLGGQMTRMG